MGTHLLQGMVRTPRLKRLVALLGDSAGRPGAAGVAAGPIEAVADATLDASIRGLEMAKSDAGLAYCFYLLTQITQAARQEDFAAALEGAGLLPARRVVGLPDAPIRLDAEQAPPTLTVFGLAAAFAATVDRHLHLARARTDLGELAQLAATESLCALCVTASQTLFGTTEATVKQSLRRFSTDAGFGRMAHDFFARLTRRYLEYHLSRELSNHVGRRRRFANVDEHNEFLLRLDRHCRVATGPVGPFARDWYGLHNFRGDLTPRKAAGFVAHALDKVREALRYQEARDAQDDGEN